MSDQLLKDILESKTEHNPFGYSEPNLLKEALEGRLAASSFADAKHEARQAVEQLPPAEVEPIELPTTTQEKTEDKSTIESPVIESEKVVEEKTAEPDEVTKWMQVANQEREMQAERMARMEQAWQQREAQYAKDAQERQQQAAQPTEEEWLPEEYKYMREQLRTEMREELARSQAPIYVQQAYDRLNLAASRFAQKEERFAKYFPPQVINEWFQQVTRTVPLDELKKTDFEHHLALAYEKHDAPFKAQEIDRLRKENEELKTKMTVHQDKAEKKANLRLVRPVSQQGAATKSIRDNIDGIDPKLDFKHFANRLKKELAAQ